MRTTVAEEATVWYRDRSTWLDAYARGLKESMPLTKGTMQHYAFIAWRAARAERDNLAPEPVMPCRVCRGVRVCDLDAHRSLGWH